MSKLYNNNVIAALILVFNVIMAANFLIIHENLQEGEKISGSVIKSSVSLCVGQGAPILNLFTPAGGEIINGTFNISANITDPLGITDFNITFRSIQGANTTDIGIDTYDGDYDFNFSWKTESFADGNCNYKLKALGESSATFCSPFDDKTSGIFTIDNNFVEPTWNNFRNSVTTNFTALSRYSNLSDVVIGNQNALVNFSGDGFNFDSVNIDGEIEAGFNSINLSLTSECLVPLTVEMKIFSLNFTDARIIRNGIECSTSICSDITFENTNLSFTTNRLGRYSAEENGSVKSSTLTLSDSTDNETKKAEEDVLFEGNYSNNPPISGNNIFCEIKFKIGAAFTKPKNMTFNGSKGVYQYARSFPSRGNYTWNVFCDGSAGLFENQNKTNKTVIANTPPKLTENISALEWNEDTTLTGLSLPAHFSDADEDNLTFSHTPVSNILIVIDSDGIVSLIPDTNFFGLRRVVFYANDSINATPSNNVTLTVNNVPEPTSSSPSGGGGGGGGGAGFSCLEEWFCEDWSVCEDGKRTRECHDLNNCGTENEKPNETQECSYVGTCYDGVKNNGEEGVDCGGPCPSCFTCYDRQKNQDETDIDCGGKNCKACRNGRKCLVDSDCKSGYCNPNRVCAEPTCSDGWQNQGEDGVDCGGPCENKCPQVEQPGVVEEGLGYLVNPMALSIAVVVLALLLTANVFRYPLMEKAMMWGYKVPIIKKPLPAEAVESAASNAMRRLDKLEKELTSKNTRNTLEKLEFVYKNLLEEALSLQKGFSIEDFQKALQRTKINKEVKKHLLAYLERIQDYRSAKPAKKDVGALIVYGEKLVSILKKSV